MKTKMYKVTNNKKSYKRTYQNGTAFVLPNLLPKRKISLLTRIKFGLKMWYEKWKYHIASLVLGAIIGCLIGLFLADNPYKQVKLDSLNDVGRNIDVKAVEVTPQRYCGDPQAYLRCKAQDLGISDTTTSKIINMISTCENGKWKPDAYNINTDAHRTMDVGIMMVNLYWHPDVTLSDMVDYKKNIDYGLKMFLDQGFEPWSCAHKLGYVK